MGQIRQYVQQAKTAADGGDIERAHNLAVKAHLLSEELGETLGPSSPRAAAPIRSLYFPLARAASTLHSGSWERGWTGPWIFTASIRMSRASLIRLSLA